MSRKQTPLPYFHKAQQDTMERVKGSIDNFSEKELSRFVELLVKERAHRILVFTLGMAKMQKLGISEKQLKRRDDRIG